jgi:hypothetical protein
MDFLDIYHALLGQSCFTKFMAVHNYTYLKLKMPNPNGVIIVAGSFEQTYYCDQDCITQAAAMSISCSPASFCHDTGRAPVKEGSPRR